jgi:hypothetical protein
MVSESVSENVVELAIHLLGLFLRHHASHSGPDLVSPSVSCMKTSSCAACPLCWCRVTPRSIVC